MSIFAKKISKEELDAIYKQVQSISDYLMKLTDYYFGSLFENESEEEETFRLFNAETTVLYAMYEKWINSKVPVRTVIGRTADIRELLADSHNYSYDFAFELFDAVKDRVRDEQKNYSAEEVEMAYACSFFDTSIGIAMEDKGISAEDVGDDLIAKVCFLFADAILKGLKGIVDISKSIVEFDILADEGQAIFSKAQILNLTLNLMLAKRHLDRDTFSKVCDLYVEFQTNKSYIEKEMMDVFAYSSAFIQITLDFSYYATSIDSFINRDFSPASLEEKQNVESEESAEYEEYDDVSGEYIYKESYLWSKNDGSISDAFDIGFECTIELSDDFDCTVSINEEQYDGVWEYSDNENIEISGFEDIDEPIIRGLSDYCVKISSILLKVYENDRENEDNDIIHVFVRND